MSITKRRTLIRRSADKAGNTLYFQCAPYIQTQITVVAGFGGISFQLESKKGDLFVTWNLTISRVIV